MTTFDSSRPDRTGRLRCRFSLLAAMILTLGPAAISACAQQSAAASNADDEFRRFDITESGWLSGTEVKACKCAHMDTNGDGEITLAEYRAGRAQPERRDETPRPAQSPEAPTKVGSFITLSDLNSASYSSLAIDAAGIIHAAWLDRETGSPTALYHRASHDNGRTWSGPVELSVGQPAGVTGIPRVIANGRQVFVVWKVVDQSRSMAADEQISRAEFGTVVYRVLEGGRWTDVLPVTREKAALSWFASAGPGGSVHVMWSENPGETNFMTTQYEANVIRHTTIDASGIGTSDVVCQEDGFGYWGLHGYVDGRGVPQWVALKNSANDQTPLLTVFAGSEAQGTMEFNMYGGYGDHSLPQRVQDHTGRDHVIFYSGNGAEATLLDMILDDKTVTVYQRRSESAEIRDFQVTRGPTGQLVATVQVAGEDEREKVADLYVTVFDGTSWGAPVNVTDNAGRTRVAGVTDRRGNSLGNVTTYSARSAAAAYDSEGTLHLLMSGLERTAHENTVNWAGAWANSKLYFTRF